MPLVNVMINGRAYTMGCDEGEEDHLKDLAGLVDVKAREALGMVGQQAGDTKMMLMAAILIADEFHDATAKLATGTQTAGAETTALREEHRVMHLHAEKIQSDAADVLEGAAAKLEALAARLVRA